MACALLVGCCLFSFFLFLVMSCGKAESIQLVRERRDADSETERCCLVDFVNSIACSESDNRKFKCPLGHYWWYLNQGMAAEPPQHGQF